MRSYLWIAMGAAAGGLLRYALTDFTITHYGFSFPWGTLTANVVGSLVIGWVAGFARPESSYYLSSEARSFLMIGLCGGFTTFSFFSWQVLLLSVADAWLRAVLYIIASLILPLAAVWIGYRIGVLTSKRTRDRK